MPFFCPAESIRGAEIAEEISVDIYPDTPFELNWKEHGLKLSISADASKSIRHNMKMKIRASVKGDYSFPTNMELVSAIYWISFPQQFAKPITLGIRHCCNLQDNVQVSSLHFVTAKCNQKQLPYMFKPLSKGSFSTNNFFGTIEVDHFSGFAVAQEGNHNGEGDRIRNKQYLAQSYYLRNLPTDWNVDIPVVTNLPTLQTVTSCTNHIMSNDVALALVKYSIILF